MKGILIATLVSFFITLITGYLLTPVLKKLKMGQPILSYVKEHHSKAGTPTMGGIFFLLGISLTCLIFFKSDSKMALISLCITIGYGIVGFLDDFIKVKFKKNMGLRAYQKIIFQLSLAVIASYFAYLNSTELIIPFINKTIDLGWLIIPFSIFVFLAVTNGVNLTDGLDGLAAGTTFVYTAFFSVLIIFAGTALNLSGRINQYNEYYNLAVLTLACTGALLAFIFFNSNPAKIFMGDTGALALGGLLASLSVFTEFTLFVPIMGVMYIVSCASVIIQVVYFKATKGKRVFKMAPYHHHLQLKGMAESKISILYMIITAVVSLLVVIFYI